MNYTVWKYPLDLTDVQEVEMPSFTRPLVVGDQDGILTLWAWCDRDAPKVKRKIVIVGTGNRAPPPGNADYVGTVMMGEYVWHVFLMREFAS